MKVNEVNRQRSQTGRDRIHNLFILDRMDVCILFFFCRTFFFKEEDAPLNMREVGRVVVVLDNDNALEIYSQGVGMEEQSAISSISASTSPPPLDLSTE